MSDLIDRQMAIDAVLRVAQTCPAEFENSGDARMGYIAAIQSIYHEFKAISPARLEPIYCRDCRNWELINKALSTRPEVIRCRDCCYWIPGLITDNDCFIPPKCGKYQRGKYQQLVGHSADDYCSYAKRREVIE